MSDYAIKPVKFKIIWSSLRCGRRFEESYKNGVSTGMLCSIFVDRSLFIYTVLIGGEVDEIFRTVSL